MCEGLYLLILFSIRWELIKTCAVPVEGVQELIDVIWPLGRVVECCAHCDDVCKRCSWMTCYPTTFS